MNNLGKAIFGGLILALASGPAYAGKKLVEYRVLCQNIYPDRAKTDKLTQKLRADGWNASTIGLHPDKNPKITNYHTELTTKTALSQDELWKVLDSYERVAFFRPEEISFKKNKKELEKIITDVFAAAQENNLNKYLSFFNNEVVYLNNGKKLEFNEKTISFGKTPVKRKIKNVYASNMGLMTESLKEQRLDKFYTYSEDDCCVDIAYEENSKTKLGIFILRKINNNWKIIAEGEGKIR